jgi:Na+/proline symporter
MSIFGLHPADWIVIGLYIAAMAWIGRATAGGVRRQSDYFLAGRKLGGGLQFFLNFGNMTDASGAAKTSSFVYSQGAGGVWMSMQLLFLTPYYWFMNAWFRRSRLTTVADLFTDRFGNKTLATIYACMTLLTGIMIIGGSYLVSYKILGAIVTKPPAVYTTADRRMIEDYNEFARLDADFQNGRLDGPRRDRHAQLRQLRDRGELQSFVSYIKPLPLYFTMSVVVALYLVAGGMAAAAISDAVQGLLIIAFSIIFIPFGLAKLGGITAMHEKLPGRMLEVFGAGGSTEFAWYSELAILLVTIEQAHSVYGNMSVAGSARDERAASLGAVTGGMTKRLMTIAWCFCGLLAFALFGSGISDADMVWGELSRTLLGPGFLGLMLVGVLAAEMSTISCMGMSLSALFVRNIYLAAFPARTEAQGLRMGRLIIFAALLGGVGVAAIFTDIFSLAKVTLTLGVSFGATIWLIFKWRRITHAGALLGVGASLLLIVVIPFAVALAPGLRDLPALHRTTGGRRIETTRPAGAEDVAAGLAAEPGAPVKSQAVIAARPLFFERVTDIDPAVPAAGKRGRGRFHVELFMLSLAGLDLSGCGPAQLLAVMYGFDALAPFILLIGFSLLTKENDPARAARFYARMRTPVAGGHDRDAAAVEHAVSNPAESEHRKLFPRSSWEFQKWSRTDMIAFPLCCLCALAVLALFAFILRIGRG